jgi:hypothetical protein
MKSFTKKREPIWFEINGVELRAKPAVGIATAQQAMNVKDELNKATGGEQLGKIVEMFGMLLHSSSKEAFAAVVSDEDEPVDPEQLVDMLHYVMERQGLRPTQQYSESSESPPNGQPGTHGEDGVSPEA